jgi:lipopolysaccharide export system protein LptA
MKTWSIGRLRLVLAGLVALVTAAVVWNIRRPEPAPSPLPTTDNGHEGDQAEGVELCRVVGSSEEWCLKAKHEFGREGGQRDWGGGVVFRTTYMASGKSEGLTIRSERCLFQPKPLEARFEGDAEIVTERGVEIQTDSVLYRGDEDSAVSDGRVDFRRKRLSGSATGMRYDARKGLVELVADVALAIDDPIRGPLSITGRRAVFSRADEQFQLIDDVVIEQAHTRMTAGILFAEFNLLEGRLLGLLALSNVEVHSNGAILQSGGIIGAPPGSYRLRGPRLSVSMRSDGSPAEILAGHGGAELTIIPSEGRPNEQRRIEAGGFVAFRLDPDGRVEEVEARKDVIYQVEWSAPQATGGGKSRQRLECKWMVVRLDPGTGKIREGEFDRQVVFEDQGRRATASNARFQESMLRFTGKPELRTADGSRLQAREIAIGTGESAGKMWAMGDVRHVANRKGEGLLGSDGTTIVSEAFDFDSSLQKAHYQGGTRLTSGSDEIVASDVLLVGERPQRRVQAEGEVRTSFRDRASAENGERIVVQAKKMVYDEDRALITYTGEVEFRKEDFITRTPEAMFMDLDPQGVLLKVTAQGEKVEIVHHERTVQGQKVVYNPQTSTLVIRGKPVVLRDSANESRGPSLTIDLKTDRTVMDGLNEQRTGLRIAPSNAKATPGEKK